MMKLNLFSISMILLCVLLIGVIVHGILFRRRELKKYYAYENYHKLMNRGMFKDSTNKKIIHYPYDSEWEEVPCEYVGRVNDEA